LESKEDHVCVFQHDLRPTQNCISELYKIQRDIAKKPDAVSNADRFAYFAAAYVLAAAELPNGYPLSEVLAALVPGNEA
jgi:hypothetical protein